MSSIDSYKHKLLGFIHCDSDFDIVDNNPTRKIALYRLDQDIPSEEKWFDGKTNDILLGGGSGEAPAFRISYPKAFKFFTQKGFHDFGEYGQLFKAFWSPTESFKLCNGFIKLGWRPDEYIEFWLAKEVIKLLSQHIPEYSNLGLLESHCNLLFTKEA